MCTPLDYIVGSRTKGHFTMKLYSVCSALFMSSIFTLEKSEKCANTYFNNQCDCCLTVLGRTCMVKNEL